MNSGTGWFAPVDRRIGVAKPPSRPSTAMKSESCLIDRSTAVRVTSASRPKAIVPGMRCQSECAAKKVANRMAMAAASIALARSGYLRAAFRSQATSRPMATMMPMTTRTGGCNQPASIE
ncbi:MAG: hypothetical protein A3J29_21070 [Acidobacteria bacterium RIFCSPLOWO2_12_FULL_67_14b]|nr:MAG: hypothetical protein A3J29_21070 [Acidobacteria bacterium RIFCSPLOWO2_12_FULL_67_14b]